MTILAIVGAAALAFLVAAVIGFAYAVWLDWVNRRTARVALDWRDREDPDGV